MLAWPLSLLYGLVMLIRNWLYDNKLIPSASFQAAVISVGNLGVGGAGKTPHTEYLVSLLKDKRNIAVLSRGYKRKTRGYRLVEVDSTPLEAGDEPLQIKRKFPMVMVVVDENRKMGIQRILNENPGIDTIILDDAFQHRAVRPGLNLLLTEYYKPFFQNFPMPTGSLREFRTGAKRADALVVTKTPSVFSPLDRRYILQKLQPYRQSKHVFFSYLAYQGFQSLWGQDHLPAGTSFKSVILLTAIANPSALEEHLKLHCEELFPYCFRDHHNFRPRELKKIRDHFSSMISRSKAIITTEKDAMRLQNKEAREILGDLPVYYITVRVAFHTPDRKKFEDLIWSYLNSVRP